jgi:hypothetical protein
MLVVSAGAFILRPARLGVNAGPDPRFGDEQSRGKFGHSIDIPNREA